MSIQYQQKSDSIELSTQSLQHIILALQPVHHDGCGEIAGKFDTNAKSMIKSLSRHSKTHYIEYLFF